MIDRDIGTQQAHQQQQNTDAREALCSQGPNFFHLTHAIVRVAMCQKQAMGVGG